jgi:hypothetical protein
MRFPVCESDGKFSYKFPNKNALHAPLLVSWQPGQHLTMIKISVQNAIDIYNRTFDAMSFALFTSVLLLSVTLVFMAKLSIQIL